MSERNTTVYIHNLDISERTRNALIRFGILTLNELLEKKDMDFSKIRNVGADSIQEIYSIIEHADEIFDQYETRKQRIDEMVEEAGHVSADELKFGTRAKHALHMAGIHTIADMLRMSSMDIMNLHNIGAKTRDEIAVTVERIITEGQCYIDKRQIAALGYCALEEEGEEQSVEKGFDFITIDVLTERFAFKTVRMTDWFGLSRQGIYNAIEKRSPKRRDTWIGKELSEFERDILIGLINEKCFVNSDDTVTCCCMNNRQNDFVCLFIYENEIKCFFLADLPEDIQEQIIAVSMHRFTERELSGGHEGDVISVLKVKYFCPNDLTVFRSLASFRGMSADEYAMFLYGYPYIASRNVTDEQIIAFFEENMVEGKVYISSDPKNQWIRSYASRNGYGIKEFIEFFGYESKMDGTELTSDAARERHIEELKQCIVKDNIVYFPTDSHIYKVLQTYTYNKGTTVNEYLKSLGFKRTLEKPEIVADILETDMQVYKSDGKFEEKVFAFYPLIGSKIIKQEILDKLNENARKYIDMVLREPWTKLTLRAEMQITLALINNAKTWKNEENSNFWNYTSLQFGYRDTNGAIVRLLQSALEDAMKKNRRLFIEDSNGRAFKSTAVIHALSTKKSWMALFDFLFDFYKNNLNWKAIPGDPLIELMVEALQKKLVYDNCDADTELTISSRVYSFQEGIRKLILMRPVYTRGLFEKLIAKIDALINSTEITVKTYEEQLCEEWFKEKITAIANTKRTEHQAFNVQKDVALDYSRIRAKYILKNENEVQIGIPDIRLRSEGVSRAMLSIYYNGHLAAQQNMSWYGNELGKTLNGASMTLPELSCDCGSLMISMKITCDGKDIYDSEETLFRRVLAFSGGSEVIANQMKKGNYTLVMAQSADFKIENADVTEIDEFKNAGFKSYFVEYQDGYLISVDGKLVSFDSEGVTDIRIISPTESMGLPGIEIEGEEYQLAYRNSACSVILGNADFLQQFIILKNGERLEFKDLPEVANNNGLAFTCSLTDTGSEDTCRIQIINIGNERLMFDRSFLLISSAKCSFDREFYYSSADYDDALLTVKIDDYEEAVPFSQEDDEIRVSFRAGELHITVPKIHVEETSGDWMNGSAPAWYIGDIPQTSLLKVCAPNKIDIRFMVGGKEVMYDGQGIVTIGNVLQSLCSVESMSLAEIEMSVHGRGQNSKYSLARVSYKERFLTKPEFWTEKNKMFWNQGSIFIGKAGRTFTLDLLRTGDTPLSFQLDEDTEYIEIPEDMEIGVYHYQISIISGGMFKHTKEVIAEGDCIIGDQNLLRFKDRQIVIESLTDEFNEEVGHIPIRACYIDNLKFMGMQDTSEGYCPVYSGVMFTTGYRGERYEFSFDAHTNHKGITKMMVNPVRIVYVNNTALCITDSDGDGLYYYHYYDKYVETRVNALTDHEYTKQNRQNYSNADLYSYRTERIKDV
ncbi:hypothetical protein FYJ38_23250 [Clostridium sp. WB02_MRS01]|uniref:DNA-directed RNA polymerase subunit alpha C-terminal domain-containing protein n=1 Tax=Clostridium sp. WB02_MRS01 TaxID=2605777 RepID=UPI0012B1D0B9|nr:DNA-directed RNA polymerase subunit alpha C-terminal domain-containing protein [Clostridium sp. WB02_MRS01]MSS11526.1 hypothetical protein [Clostridium sp. WB02_MRS01]